jgi:hypothetical protein
LNLIIYNDIIVYFCININKKSVSEITTDITPLPGLTELEQERGGTLADSLFASLGPSFRGWVSLKFRTVINGCDHSEVWGWFAKV